ncbi:hypothetical protein CYMTET_11519 [Cymbomonas tetramitiformis]|uniref:Integrase catalytic domain-containing protein n=1 Tax=Cymbomonas tetramitiformis TaxID=36881 RepID=A0AAE0GM60_9CHLO|nr:hypothetical protein CYMTET_11519 [Cymbomonas tetramitiformis]
MGLEKFNLLFFGGAPSTPSKTFARSIPILLADEFFTLVPSKDLSLDLGSVRLASRHSQANCAFLLEYLQSKAREFSGGKELVAPISGIEQRHGSPYLHENQARVERAHRTVQAMARALLLTSGFGVDVWPLVVRHSVYILNRTFQKPLHKKSPYYRLYGRHQDLSHLRVFGCLAYAFVDPDNREHKFSDRARQLRYVGHSEVSSAYLLYDPDSGKIVKSGMVKFQEAVDKLGKVVTTWDPSVVAPLSTNFMVTALDGTYHDTLPSTFAPCTQLSSVRLLIILALNLALNVYHMDVETAFLNSVLEEDLYVRLPRGLEYQGRTCAKLLKAVYGLKQAGKEWFETSDAFIMAYDVRMRRNDVEPCLYYIRDSGITVIILAYVDDYIVATNSNSWYDNFVAAFNSKYACKDLGVLDLVMGIGVRWGPGMAYLSQSGYISQMIETYGLQDAKPASLPMSPGCSLAPSDGKDATIPFKGLLGQLQWVARCARPDIMAAVSALSRFCASYGPEHFVALKQVVRYLKGTVDHELVLRTTSSLPRGLGLASGALPLCIYTDADYAGCKTTRRSTYGIAVYLCGSLLIFSSIMQMCVSLSTTEAEIIAMSEGAREIKYIINVLTDLVDIYTPVQMYCDNQGAIHLASDYVNNNRSKHIEVRNMYIRELVKSKMVEAMYVASEDNTADIFTKPLPLPAFLIHRERLGIIKLQNSTSED